MSETGLTVDRNTSTGVLTIRINRPHIYNALAPETFEALATEIESTQTDHDIRAIVIGTTGKHFTAGWELGTSALPGFWGSEPGYPRFMRALETCSVPVIAAVRGVAVGIGLTMLGQVDIVIADKTARFSAPFASLGISPEAGSTATLTALIGYQRTAELFLTGRQLMANEAVEIGLALKVVEPEALDNEVEHLAKSIASNPSQSIRATKRLMQKLRNTHAIPARELEDLVFADLVQTEVFQQATAAWTTRKEA